MDPAQALEFKAAHLDLLQSISSSTIRTNSLLPCPGILESSDTPSIAVVIPHLQPNTQPPQRT